MKANTADINVLNVNVQAVVKDLNVIDTYTENLIVNKPVQDISLRTPHLENTTSLNGNFYAPNIIDAKISGDVSGNLSDITVNDLFVSNASVSNLYVNTSSTPIQSSAVLGYDSEGKVIPIRATYEVGFPENADYLFTDEHGTAFSGVKATEVGEVENLITAYGVKNAIDAVNVEVTDAIDALNVEVTDNFNLINGNFNNVANTFNEVNTNIENIENSIDTLNNTTNNISNNLDSLISALRPVLGAVTNVSGWNNSTSPLNIQGITEFKVSPFMSPVMTGEDVGNGAKLNVNDTVVTLSLPSLLWKMENMSQTFFNCNNLNQNIQIPDGVVNMYRTFSYCGKLNQNILIPNSVTNMYETFFYCNSLNQNIQIPNSVVDMYETFRYCINLNQNILIPNSVTNMAKTFRYCSNLNQSILIPNSVIIMTNAFCNCDNLNQSDIYIYSQNLESLKDSFTGCHINNVHIPTSVPKDTSNLIYNSLVNGITGITFPAANVFNDLPVDPTVWPPV